MKRTTACFLAAMTAFATATQAADIFVAPEGRGAMTGADWSNALNGSRDGFHIDVKNAILAAVADGATEVNVYYAGGTYAVTNQLALGSITIPVKLSGGYLSETDGSLAKGEIATTFSRTANYIRFFSASAVSSLRIEGITFSGGLLEKSAQGGAVYLSASSSTLSNCIFTGNRIAKGTGNNYYTGKGSAVYATGGSLSIVDCEFRSNYTSGGYNPHWGGALCTLKTDLLVDGCTFADNYVSSMQNGCIGGAVCINGYRATILNSTFENNYAENSSNTGTGLPVGGALAVRSATRFEMSDCRLVKNYVKVYNGTRTSAIISGYYFDDFNTADGVMTAIVERCVFDSRSVSTTAKYIKSDILLNCGSLFMTNCLVMGARGNHEAMKDSVRAQRAAFPSKSSLADLVSGKVALVIPTCSMELVNCTIADGKDVGAEAVGSDSELTLKNCISWGHTVSGVVNAASVAYSCIQEAHEGVGNFVADPHWTGAPYYHLLTKRAGGAITDGWFGGTYNSPKTEKNSPCLDVGAPDKARAALEPRPNGRRVNLGAYGGTPWATKTLSPPPTTFAVQ